MKYSIITFIVLSVLPGLCRSQVIPDHFKRVDQTIWVVSDIDSVIMRWKRLGFNQIRLIGNVKCNLKYKPGILPLRWLWPISGVPILTG